MIPDVRDGTQVTPLASGGSAAPGRRRRRSMRLPVVLWAAAAVGCTLLPAHSRRIPGQDVRYEPTPLPVVRAMLELAQVGPHDVVMDLGSGDGRIAIMAAREFGARAIGIEIDPALVAVARSNARAAGVAARVRFLAGDMYTADLGDASVVTLFLHPGPNRKLRARLRAALAPGARVVSYMWDMGDWKPHDTRRIGRRRIYLWRL